MLSEFINIRFVHRHRDAAVSLHLYIGFLVRLAEPRESSGRGKKERLKNLNG